MGLSASLYLESRVLQGRSCGPRRCRICCPVPSCPCGKRGFQCDFLALARSRNLWWSLHLKNCHPWNVKSERGGRVGWHGRGRCFGGQGAWRRCAQLPLLCAVLRPPESFSHQLLHTAEGSARWGPNPKWGQGAGSIEVYRGRWGGVSGTVLSVLVPSSGCLKTERGEH